MKNAALALLISILMPTLSVPSFAASAVWENATCTWHFSGTGREDPLVGSFFASFGSGAVLKACEFLFSEEPAYFLAKTVRRSPLGVCQYIIDQTYPLQAPPDGKTQWSFQPPPEWNFPAVHEVFMSVASAECPLQSDKAYVSATSVSQGVFFSFVEFWKGAQARNSIPVDATKYMPPQDRQSDDYLNFEKMIGNTADLHDDSSRSLELLYVGVANRLPNMNGIFFEAVFGVRGDNVTLWTVVFDVMPDEGIQVLKVSRGII